MTLVVAGASGTADHDTGPGHPECPARVQAALAGLEVSGVSDDAVRPPARAAGWDELVRVHDGSYLRALQRFCAAGGGDLDPDTPATPGSWDAAVEAAGAGLAALDAVRSGRGDAAFVIARPPGHHASATRAMGFCLLNNVAIAAGALVASGERVAIVDWDVHHGNGTQEIFWDDPRVLYFSTHQSPHYPGTGGMGETGGDGAPGLTVNVPLPAGTTGDGLRRALDDVLAPVLDSFRPGWLLISAGFDAHRDDPLAGFLLTAGDFADLTRRVTALAPPGRVVAFLEGGYDLDALRASVGATAAALAGGDYVPEPRSGGGPGQGVVAAARALHEEFRGGW